MTSTSVRQDGRRLVVGTLLYAGGLLLYVLVQRWTWRDPLVIAWQPFDIMVPPQPLAVWIYVSLYLMILVPWWSAPRWDQVRLMALRLSLSTVLGCALFVVFPTTIVRPALPDADGATTAVISWIHRFDLPGNALPSMHAAFGILIMQAGWQVMPRLRVMWLVWLVLVLWSCIALRQHSWLDLAGGLMLGVLMVRLVRPQEPTS